MERRIDLSNLDLDAAAEAIASRVELWRAAGLTVGEMTWMDNDAEWPRQLEPREGVTRPMSVGIQLHRTDGAEAEAVLYAGGWADFAVYVPGQETTSSHVELEAVDEFGGIVDDMFDRLVDGPKYQ